MDDRGVASPSVLRRPFDEVEHAFINAARALTSHLDIEEVCSAVLDAVGDVFGAASSWILLYDESDRGANVRG